MNLRFITDEDVPRSTARVLRDAGFDAVDVRDVGLRAVQEVGENLLHHLAIVEIGKVRLRG
jgi:hypothetical protein